MSGTHRILMNVGNESQQIPLVTHYLCFCPLLKQAAVTVIAFVDRFGITAEKQAEALGDFPAE